MAVRAKASGLQLVTLQQFSPEKNHYKFINSKERFSSDTYFHIALPIMGEWNISQGYEGDITHKGEWKHALDFVIQDDANSTYKEPGTALKDFYCYDSPVVAPADGWVVKILDGIEDNNIGDVDLANNWGNTIILKHGEYVFSKLSHLKKDTLKIKSGDHVSRGDIIGYCGSSGRSPEPHLHFQVQSTPFIGSKTLEHPISYYMSINEDKHIFHSFEVPKEGEIVKNVSPTKLLTEAFSLIPGKTLKFNVRNNDGSEEVVKWEVFATALNQTYIFCHKTKATAYFVNNGTVLYFTDFYGAKSSLLHSLYLGAHKVLLGYYEGIVVEDDLLIDSFVNPATKFVHDFTAPFFHYCKAHYRFVFSEVDEAHNPSRIVFRSSCHGEIFGRISQTIDFSFLLEDNKISEFEVNNKGNITTAKWVD